ncbi:hypothetical protein FOCC_FOCC015603 [Frankliniella occidentalis]|uniref:Uncharacterized protein LOC113213203 n=1 Tax=Frankliniella occidentalis TaxID=133901 RepID=A0A6J1TB50_FRAOC|nr:uncharacterized protein LOC113213203 [Frankliniella occidentalis]KAE8738902.1 hypothetical protein FOCC_FOCC015603 [Frankliniella occidentalis]
MRPAVALQAENPKAKNPLQRLKRVQQRHAKKLQEIVQNGQDILQDENIQDNIEEERTAEDLAAELKTTILERDTLRQERDALQLRVDILEAENKRYHQQYGFEEAGLENDQKKVHFYTGLPSFTLLMAVFNLCKDHVPSSHRNVLTPFQEFMVVMMRLRLNLLMEDLAFRFGVTQSTISRIITRWLDVMALRLKSFIVWPEREVLIKTMPECFKKNFGTSVTLIIDCFELFIETPSNLVGRVGSWSQYKHHNTVKFLIGITPQGTICYISKAYVGRMQDTQLTNHCGILDNLKSGDVVLSDRGFNISNTAGFLRAHVVQPAYLFGRPQLTGEEVDSTRKIAAVRVHVERVIGLVRLKYRILSDRMPTDSLKTKPDQAMPPVDQIAVVCCALCNLCPPIIPMFDREE